MEMDEAEKNCLANLWPRAEMYRSEGLGERDSSLRHIQYRLFFCFLFNHALYTYSHLSSDQCTLSVLILIALSFKCGAAILGEAGRPGRGRPSKVSGPRR